VSDKRRLDEMVHLWPEETPCPKCSRKLNHESNYQHGHSKEWTRRWHCYYGRCGFRASAEVFKEDLEASPHTGSTLRVKETSGES
jgi:hypothetical protein